MNGSKILRSISGSAHPSCASVASGKVWCGDRAGGLDIFSFSGDRLFTLQVERGEGGEGREEGEEGKKRQKSS